MADFLKNLWSGIFSFPAFRWTETLLQKLETVFNWIWEKFFNILTNLLVGIVNLTNQIGSAGLFSPTANAAVELARTVGVAMFGVGVVMLLIDIAENINRGQTVSYGKLGFDIAKGFAFAYYAPEMGRRILNLVISMVGALGMDTDAELSPVTKLLTAITQGAPAIGLLLMFIVVAIIAAIYFLFKAIQRTGIMLMHCMTAPLYVASIVRGDDTALLTWMRQAIAISLELFFHAALFYAGWASIGSGITGAIGAYSFWLAMPQAEKILQKYGFSAKPTGMMNTAFNTAKGLVTGGAKR